ncbi:MAG: glycosyltransferase family 4 protein [Candidatus Firestonebacteria bacterium]|nr:glycosyltransferase family 4 protein [Candidatus Firestonebacteria bacterium]
MIYNSIKIAVTGTRGFPDIQGGVETHCEQLYPGLVKLGCDVTVFTRKPYITSNINIYNGVKLISIDCPKNKFLEALVHTFRSILEAKKINPDILHIHAIGPSLFALLARVLGMNVVVTNHGPDYKRKKWTLPAKFFLKFCEMIGVLFANEIIAITSDISNNIKLSYGKNSVIIPNGVNIPCYLETEEVLKKFDIEKGKYILTVGRFVPEKGFIDLIEVFNSSEYNNWKLVIAGNADHEDKYSLNLKAEANKNSNIILTGFLTGESLQEIYSHAGLFVLPSYYEGLPIVLLEAMSYGLSCIASNIPANKNIELSEDRFFKSGDIKTLEIKIKKFIDNPLSDEERKKQINMIAERYDWEKIANKTLDVYVKVLRAQAKIT